MTRRDFELIANVIRNRMTPQDGVELPERERHAICLTAHAFADALRATNPQFDRARFLKACRVES